MPIDHGRAMIVARRRAARLVGGDSDVAPSPASSIDTRTLPPGEPSSPSAATQPATATPSSPTRSRAARPAAVVREPAPTTLRRVGGPVDRWSTTRRAALRRLAAASPRALRAARRRRSPASNGKTTTKELIAAVLGVARPRAQAGGELQQPVRAAADAARLGARAPRGGVELGMNQPGEIARSRAIAEPDVGVVTNVGRRAPRVPRLARGRRRRRRASWCARSRRTARWS